jgi:hypothetical protein
MSKIILDLCGGTGAWSNPYKEAGYDVRVITLPEHDVLNFQAPSNVYGILAAPPCTMFSLARQRAKTPRDLYTASEIVLACLRIIHNARASGNLKWWAMENPRGLLRQFMGKPAYSFQQWQFGDGISKHTDLWGYFTPPKPTVKVKPNVLNAVGLDKMWQRPKAPKEYEHLGLNRQEIRSITPRGFAEAFYQANK